MRRVFWSNAARQDIIETLSYISRDNPSAARRVVDEIKDTGNKLGEFATGRHGRIEGTYEKIVLRYPFIIVYVLRSIGGQDSVVILRVIHTSRDWPKETVH